ncbi:helicase associated domain-containing protein [Pseudarthrobacter sp. MDT3-28]|uniref:helicase associated domain-containing protein n=1 Tax=Pseudarthrobacter raffinosi TaxID=2953651 RepID=UPI00208F5C34|nr:helicase associated domain-containing protein [Pseudarthrobacter sp. MDT3-28]MCO4239756.1 helicase associated domain-containing protein [Pseudarthrobacter sp. MDT3-28]
MSREHQDNRFIARYVELKAFIEQTGRRPRAESTDAAEAALGRWAVTQQTLRNAGNLAEDRLKLIEDLGNALTPRQTYADRITELAEFIQSFGRRPVYGAANASERSLAAWLNFQVIARNKGELSAERSVLLEPLVPASSTRKIRPLADWVADLAAFHAEHERMPLSTREDERGLALWLINKRMSFKEGTMSQEDIHLLSAVPGALVTRKNADPDAMLLEAQEWCAQHGHIPRASFTDTDSLSTDEEKERTIAAWMRNHARESNRAYEPSEYAERRQSILDLYDKYPSRAEFNEILARERVRKALEGADHVPSSTEDSQTHGWIANARRLRDAGADVTPETLEVLALADRLKAHTDHKRDARLDELNEFVKANGRMPGFAKLAPKEEKNLAFWTKRRLDGSRTSGSAEINEKIAELIARCTRIAEASKSVEPIQEKPANTDREKAECAKVMAALTEVGHVPGSASPVYAWLVRHRKLRAAGVSISDEISLVLEYADTLKSAREVRHERRLVDYKDFLARFDRLPTPGGEKTEASLANWASGVLRGVVSAGADVESALRRLQENQEQPTRQTTNESEGTPALRSQLWEVILDAYAKGERIASLYVGDESPEPFLDRLREAVTAEHEQSRADAIATEIRSLRQLIQDDVDSGLVDGGFGPESLSRSMVLKHRFHWLHDLAADVYETIWQKAGLNADYPMSCHSPYLDYGVLAVYGMLEGLGADRAGPISPEEASVVDGLERLLSGVPASMRRSAVCFVLGAVRQLNHAPGRPLYAREYELGRARFRDLSEEFGNLDWPAPADAVTALLGRGSWNGAMAEAGLPPVLQAGNWQGSDFICAALDFSETASELDRSPETEFAYDDWVKQQVVRGVERPSLLSMQAEFGVLTNGLRLVAGSADLAVEDADDESESQWGRVHHLLSETLSETPEGASLELRVVEEGEDLHIPLFATATITAAGADCSFPTNLVVRTEDWPQDVRRMLELGWATARDAHDVWMKEAVPLGDVASTLLAGLRECRGVVNPAQIEWSAKLPSGEPWTGLPSEGHSECESLAQEGSSQEILWADAVESLTDELLWLKDDDFVSVEYGYGTGENCPPYAQATPRESGLSLELVSEQFLSADVWPINSHFLISAGWEAPTNESPNWHMTDVPRESGAKKLLDGLRIGRECRDAGLLRWHLAVFPPEMGASYD